MTVSSLDSAAPDATLAPQTSAEVVDRISHLATLRCADLVEDADTIAIQIGLALDVPTLEFAANMLRRYAAELSEAMTQKVCA